MRSAVMRARFLLATGNNLEGKLSRIMDLYVQQLNGGEETNLGELFSLYPQNYISPESLQTIPVVRKMDTISPFSEHAGMNEADRLLYKEALKRKNRSRFSRKNINEYVVALLGDREEIPVTEVPVKSDRDLIRIIYISIYAGNRSNNYEITAIGIPFCALMTSLLDEAYYNVLPKQSHGVKDTCQLHFHTTQDSLYSPSHQQKVL